MGDVGSFYIGAVGIFAGNYAPRGWAFCSGQLLPIGQNSALFSILGTTYGGDGRSTFALPDLRGRVPIGQGTGPGLPNYRLGQRGGISTTTLSVLNMPSHNHNVSVKVADQDATHFAAFKGVLGARANNDGAADPLEVYVKSADATFTKGYELTGVTESLTGGGQAFNNMQPFLAINYCIALQGLFPPRS